MPEIIKKRYETLGGIIIDHYCIDAPYSTIIDSLCINLDNHRGILMSSSFEYPNRYSRWEIGFINPPIVITSHLKNMSIEALNLRGKIILPEIYNSLINNLAISKLTHDESVINIEIKDPEILFCEELRCKQPSVFNILRSIIELFRSDKDSMLGLYGVFGYDLTFQFEKIHFFQQRDNDSKEMILYLPDKIYEVDHKANKAICHNYEFICKGWEKNGIRRNTDGLKRNGSKNNYVPSNKVVKESEDHKTGEFIQVVHKAKEYFKRGDLFEVVPSQTFYHPCIEKPSKIFLQLKEINPAPYGLFMNLGDNEYLVGASPEMFVCVKGKQIFSCPISGTIKRGIDAIEDAQRIRELLNSRKDESELSMCTDVDRNDKSRVCIAGTVEVIGRRQIEIYQNLIHTVDYVKGQLKNEFDALDGFLAHTWTVTVTGAPKKAAMQFIEENEKSPRRWYGGAFGKIGFDGNMNTGVVIRTIRIKSGVAEVRAGSTLLIDSDPEKEETEARLKAYALRSIVTVCRNRKKVFNSSFLKERRKLIAINKSSVLCALMVDHQDSFVHNLANYFREFGVFVKTFRPDFARQYLQKVENVSTLDFVILSPGPGKPEDFKLLETINLCVENGLPLFGVCLGLQGIVKYFGGKLDLLNYPVHGKSTIVNHADSQLFKGINNSFTAGRYHSIYAASVPDSLTVTAYSEDNIVMAVEHKELPIWAVQFHPESIMSLENRVGHKVIANVIKIVAELKKKKQLKYSK